jgi:hypothetical protein
LVCGATKGWTRYRLNNTRHSASGLWATLPRGGHR